MSTGLQDATQLERARAERESCNRESLLLRLPAELRNEIYRMCVGPNERSNNTPINVRALIEGPYVGLTRTCRLLQLEVLPIFFRTGEVFLAVLLDQDGLRKWDTKAEAIVNRVCIDTLALCIPLRRVHFQLVLYCSACGIYGLEPMMRINIEFPGNDSSAVLAVRDRLREVKGFYMKEPLAVLGRLEDLGKRSNCANSWKKTSSGVEKRDVVDAMEPIKEIVEGNRKRKWAKVMAQTEHDSGVVGVEPTTS